jgi:hypothetical protein
MPRDMHGGRLVRGVNVDRVDIAAGLKQAARLGYTSPEHREVITYALRRWARGEEPGAEQTIKSGGVDWAQWRIVLAAAAASAEQAEQAVAKLAGRFRELLEEALSRDDMSAAEIARMLAEEALRGGR